jgi:tetratricopeptide (TPR) repeat protein
MSPPPFDVFLCYNSKDKPQIRTIAQRLREQGITYWLDEEQLIPGRHYRAVQERDFLRLRSVAVFVGKHGIGKYQDLEISIFIAQNRDRNLPIIPVFLSDAPSKTTLPPFLMPFSWVDFRVADPDPSERLMFGINGVRSPTAPVVIAETAQIFEAAIAANIPNNLLLQGSDTFVGRDQELKDLQVWLRSDTPVAICAVKGMGGVGKTELALQFAYQERDRQTYPGGIVWLSARQELPAQVIAFAQTHLNLRPPDDLDFTAKLDWCWQHWLPGKTLLVLDDVQDYADVESLRVPGRSRFSQLLTTRRALGGGVRSLDLEVLSEDAALELLRKLVPDGRIDAQLESARTLCEWLGYLPLGLELVGRYLARKPDVSLDKLWERLQGKGLEAQALKDRAPGTTASLGVAAAFELSWQDLPSEAQQLAAWLSLYALAPISWSWVQAYVREENEEELEDLRDANLVGRSLLQRTEAGHYQLHQLLREFFTVKRQQIEGSEAWFELFFDIIHDEARRSSKRPVRSLLEETNLVMPHLEGAIERAKANQQVLTIALGKNDLGYLYNSQGRYSEAEPLLLQALEIRRSQLGQDPDTATSLNNLAALYQSQGRYSQAEPLHLQALEIRRSQLGTDHPDTASSLNNLALLYNSQGRYSEAEPLYLQALEIWRSQLGTNHPDTATSLNNLAGLYESQGRYREAEPLHLQALEIRRSQLGQDHPDTAQSLNNLAELYQSQGRYSEAEPLYEQALEIRRSQLGQDHPKTALSLNNLAGLYESQGRYSEAEPLYLQALEIWRSQLGADHPSTATSLNNLAVLYNSQGRYSEAEPLLLQALEIVRSQLGADHPYTASSLSGLAVLYNSQGRYSEAELLFLQALEIRRSQLGADHPSTATSLNNLAGLYDSQGRYSEAEPLYLQALEIRRSQLGQDHPDTATSLNNLAYLYQSQGRYSEAEPLFASALQISEQVLGIAHPTTMTVRQNYADCLKALANRFAADLPPALQWNDNPAID